MNKGHGLIIYAVCIVACGFMLAAQKEPVEPGATVKSLIDAVEGLSKAKDQAAEARAVRRISQDFDLKGICKACLRGTWKTISAQEQKDFVALFQELLEKVAYPKSADFFKGTEIEIEDVQREGNKSEVLTVVTHPDEGMIDVAYRLELIAGRWLIKDLELDGVSLLIDLRSQMQKILREESYRELKRRMREKLS